MLAGLTMLTVAVLCMKQSIDWHRDDHRSSSIEAYYTPVEDERMGLTFLIQHQVRPTFLR